jgi:hypothetical protein
MTSTPTHPTLTDRFVAEAVRRVPRAQRADIEAELRASIADAVDGGLESGMDATAAELAALTELGEPVRLAAEFSGHSLALIGPRFYLDYVRALQVLLSTLIPLWLLIVGLTRFADGASATEAIGAAVLGALETAMSLIFFVTLVFALAERWGERGSRPATGSARAAWDPRLLPPVLDRRNYFAELIGGTVFAALIAAGLIFAQTLGAVEGPDATLIGPIQLELWQSGAFYIALLYAAVSISFHIASYSTGWSFANAIATLVLGVLFVVPTVWLAASGRLINPDYFDAIGWPAGAGVVTTIVIVVVVLLSVMDAVDGLVRAARARGRA